MGTCKKCNNVFGAFELDENKLCVQCSQINKSKESFEVIKNDQEDKEIPNLINCKTCNKTVSKNAVSCPH